MPSGSRRGSSGRRRGTRRPRRSSRSPAWRRATAAATTRTCATRACASPRPSARRSRSAREAGCAVQISHLKISSLDRWGRAAELLATIDEARRRGVRVACDQYPYHASSGGLRHHLPAWVHEGGLPALLGRLREPATRARLRYDLLEGMAKAGVSLRFYRWDLTRVSESPTRPELRRAHAGGDRRARGQGAGGRPPRSPPGGRRADGRDLLPHQRGRRADDHARPARRRRLGRPLHRPAGAARRAGARTRATSAPSRASSAATSGTRASSRCRRRFAR